MKLNSILKAFTYLFALLFIISCKTETQKDESIDAVTPMNDTIQLLDSLIKSDVRNSDLYFDRALYYKSRGVYPKAIADIYSALHIDSANVDYYLFAGELFLDMNEGVKAAGLMSKGINMNPENQELYIKAIEYNYYLQNYEASLNFANDLIQINKYNADAYFLKGMIVKEIGQEDKAISTFQTCIEVDPSFYNAHMQLGLIYSYNSDDLAVQYFENALSLDDNSREAMYAIAYHYQLKDDFIPAVKKYKEMICVTQKIMKYFSI